MTDALPPADYLSSPAHAGGDATLEHETVAAILSYRHFLKVAQRRYERLCRLSKLASKDLRRLERANSVYFSAAEKLDTQHNHLAKLVERLGYVPRINRNLFH